MESLRKKAEISKTYRLGKTLRLPVLTIKALKTNSLVFKLAVVVPKKVSKKAVVRNKIRRRVREIIRKDIAFNNLGYLVIVNIYTDISKLDNNELEKILTQGFKKLLS
jgi:ribonuclease P protein component